MPLTFIDIEKKKSWRIGVLFTVLLVLYFLVTFAFFQTFSCLFPAQYVETGSFWIIDNPSYLRKLILFTLAMAVVHFWSATFGTVRSLIRTLGASPPDPEDGIHKRLLNVMDEIRIVTGNRMKITAVVIPSLSMNAMAVTDLRGEAVIAITEGLLSRLSRPQLEAVLAHETYHILSGDCLETSVATSLFGMYASALEKIQDFTDESGRGFHPAFWIFWVLIRLSNMLNMFISREREYRADAASLRMTRNPLAMAEVLHLISRNWAGSGLISSGIEMLCIVSPEPSELDESEGWWADLMSTHPPIRKRIEVLLKMARVSPTEFERAKRAGTEAEGAAKSPGEIYFALDPKQQWQGPYSRTGLTSVPWLTPLTWISEGSDKAVERASEKRALDAIFSERLGRVMGEFSAFHCPSCRQPLLTVPYEDTKVFQCNFCGGVLVENDKIQRIIARRKKECTERIESLAEAVLRDNQRNLSMKRIGTVRTNTKPFLTCSKCNQKMFRTFYSLAYLIEIDRCNFCNVTWFDADELEMLQCVIENKISAKIRL